jgi:hypothetical protein
MPPPLLWADPNDDGTMPPAPVMSAASPFVSAAGDGEAPIAKMAMGGGAPPVFDSGPAPAVSRIPTPIEGQIDETGQQLRKLQQMDANPYGSPTNHPGVGGKILHALSVAGNIAGDIFAPSTMELIPGTQLNRRVQEGNLSSRLQELTRQQAQDEATGASTAKTKLETEELPGETADKSKLSAAQTANAESETRDRDATANNPSLAIAYSHAVQQAIKENRDPSQDPIVQHLSDAIVGLQPGQNKVAGGQHVNIVGPDGKPTIGTYHPETGKTTDANGAEIKNPQPYEKPISVNTGDNRAFQEQERGRGLLDKAEAAYRTAQQGANTMRDMVGMADAGNKMSAQMLPLEGALEITTAQGVRRINRTEVDQYAGGGSLFDKVAGEIGKVAAGQPIPSNIRNDIRKLTDAQEKAAYSTYKAAYDSATKRYGLTGEQALPEPGGGSSGVVYDDKGVGHRYKGTGDRSDPKNYEAVK